MRAIDHFRYCPRCGKPTMTADSEKSVHCWLCDFVLFVNPASAVGAIIEDKRGRVLFLRRAKDPRKGCLAAPGGFVDDGESMEEAIRREVKEETNLDVMGCRYLFSGPNEYHYHGVTYRTSDVYFVCTVKSFDSLTALDEVESLIFHSQEEVKEEDIAFGSLWKALQVYWKR